MDKKQDPSLKQKPMNRKDLQHIQLRKNTEKASDPARDKKTYSEEAIRDLEHLRFAQVSRPI